MDGLGENNAMSTPVSAEEIAFVNGKEKVKKIVKWCWLLAVVMFFIAGIVPALITLVVWFLAKLIVNKVMDKQINEHLDQSRDARRAGAARLN